MRDNEKILPDRTNEITVKGDANFSISVKTEADNTITLFVNNNWISVKNGLPEIGQIVLGYKCGDIATDSPYFILLFLAAENWEVCNDTYPNRSNYEGFIPTHWMKLPEPPK